MTGGVEAGAGAGARGSRPASVPKRHYPLLVVAALSVPAGILAGLGMGGLVAVAIPVLVACVLGLLGEVALFLSVLTAVSGVGFYWMEGGLPFGGGEINVSGLHWGLILVTSGVLLVRRRPKALSRPLLLYAFFLALAAAGLLWAPALSEGVKQLLLVGLPAVVAAVVLAYVRDVAQVRLILRSYWAAFVVAIVVAVGLSAGRWAAGEGGPLVGGVGDRTLAIFLLPIMALGLASARYRSRWFIWGVAAVALVGLATLSRTAMAVLLILPLLAMVGLPRLPRMLALGLSVLLILGALQVQAFRERFGAERIDLTEVSVQGRGSDAAVSVGGLNLSGRGWMWLQVGRHALERPVLGHGTGSATTYMRGLPRSPVVHPHNDYLRVFHDLGAVGLLAVLTFGVGTMLHFRRAHGRARTPLSSELALASYLATLAYGLIAVTDNPLVYASFFAQNVFMLYALAMVADRLEAEEDRRRVAAGAAPVFG